MYFYFSLLICYECRHSFFLMSFTPVSDAIIVLFFSSLIDTPHAIAYADLLIRYSAFSSAMP